MTSIFRFSIRICVVDFRWFDDIFPIDSCCPGDLEIRSREKCVCTYLALIGKLILRTFPRCSANITDSTLFVDSRSIDALESSARICVRRHVAEFLKKKRTDTQNLSFHVCAISRSSDFSPSFDTAMPHPVITRANDSNWKFVGRDLTSYFNRPILWWSDHPVVGTIVYVTVYCFLPLVHHNSSNVRIFVKWSLHDPYIYMYVYVYMYINRSRELEGEAAKRPTSLAIDRNDICIPYVPSPFAFDRSSST